MNDRARIMHDLAGPQVRLICAARGVRRLAAFGSLIRGQSFRDARAFDQRSDVDLVVEFRGNVETPGCELAALERELADVLGRRIDAKTPATLGCGIRAEVLNECVDVFLDF